AEARVSRDALKRPAIRFQILALAPVAKPVAHRVVEGDVLLLRDGALLLRLDELAGDILRLKAGLLGRRARHANRWACPGGGLLLRQRAVPTGGEAEKCDRCDGPGR